MDIAELFGYTGMVVGTLVFVPQVYKTYHTKSVEDISWGMLVLLVLNCVSWFSYGYLRDSLPLILTNGISLLVISVLITLKIRYRNYP
ncbi:MAG: SemiSWEET family transporter [Patescibacteria group bacterium]